MRNGLKKAAALLAAYFLILAGWAPPVHAQQGTVASFVAGERVVSAYNFGFNGVPGAFITSGNTATGSQTITICPAQLALPDGRTAFILGGQAGAAAVPITIDPQNSTVSETVTPTAVSLIPPPNGVNMNQAFKCANVTASFNNLHGASNNSRQVISGDGGLQEAINDAMNGQGSGGAQGGGSAAGGVVTIPPDSAPYVTNAIIAAAVPYSNVEIVDKRSGLQYWHSNQTASTVLAIPTTLTAQAACDSTHQFCSDSTVVGTWTSGQLFGCVSYVDIDGQEGGCSATANIGTTVVSKAIDVAAPAASAGAVGFTIYLSLIGGSYAASYQVPITSSVCTLTTLETTTPACAVANTTYNQSASTFGKNALFNGGAQITAPTLNTSPGLLLKTIASSTSDYVGNPNGRTTYGWTPSSRPGIPGVPSYSLPFAITTAAATTVPNVVATINLPPGYMNLIGRGIRVCGFSSSTGTSTATITAFTLWWEASVSNAAGPLPVTVGGPAMSGTALASAIDNYGFCQDVTTTATGTTGSLLPGAGWVAQGDTVNNTHAGASTNVQVGAVGTANLLNSGGFATHLHVVYLHTTGTDGAGMIAQKITIEGL